MGWSKGTQKTGGWLPLLWYCLPMKNMVRLVVGRNYIIPHTLNSAFFITTMYYWVSVIFLHMQIHCTRRRNLLLIIYMWCSCFEIKLLKGRTEMFYGETEKMRVRRLEFYFIFRSWKKKGVFCCKILLFCLHCKSLKYV